MRIWIMGSCGLAAGAAEPGAAKGIPTPLSRAIAGIPDRHADAGTP